MRIRRKFLQLTKQTIPYGNEYRMIKFLPKGTQMDEFGNFFLTIGDGFTTMFTCHLDTACSYRKNVVHIHENNLIGTDGKTILGADDKAGLVVLLYMIEKNIPGLYYFFIGEEVGCIGSSELSSGFDWPNITKVISFDRRGTTSVITHQLYGRCCSNEFAELLSYRLNSTGLGLNLSPDNTGIMTDSAQFTDIVPECTNISVGYYNEHTTDEIQDIEYLAKLCQACVKIDWETLPVVRIPGDNDIDYPGWDDEDDDEIKKKSDDFKETYYTNIIENDNTKKMFISKSWIEKEQYEIEEVLSQKGYCPEYVYWDGRNCYCQEEGDSQYSFVGTRSDLINFLPSLENIPYSHLKENITEDIF
jgi:hypothetical protein